MGVGRGVDFVKLVYALKFGCFPPPPPPKYCVAGLH